MCVSWSFALREWTPEGCTTSVNQDGIVTCSCNHLTNFAVLVVINLMCSHYTHHMIHESSYCPMCVGCMLKTRGLPGK